jgi:hypothetical protein
MRSAAENLLLFLCATAAVAAAAAALNFVVDPLQLLRPARFYSPMYSNDSRVQDAGLIVSQRFDTAFMGTSLAIHFRQRDIDRLLGVHSLKLSMTGSNSHEQAFVLAAALERHPKRVIWEVDDWIFCDAPAIDSDIYLTADLYRRNARGVAGYLFNAGVARESLWTLLRSIPRLAPAAAPLTAGFPFKFTVGDVDDINTIEPERAASAYNAQLAMVEFVRITGPSRSAYLGNGYGYDAMVRNFEQDAIDLISGHPEVEFDLYFPPYSILQWVAMRDASPATLKIVYDLTAHISERLTRFPNARLHDFRALQHVTHNLDNYGDVIHHSPAIDLEVLSWLADRSHVVDPSSPTASLDRLKAQVEAYRIER